MLSQGERCKCVRKEQLIIDMHYVTSFITNETALTLLRHTGTHSHTGIMFIITQQNVDIVCFADKCTKKRVHIQTNSTSTSAQIRISFPETCN